MKKKHEKLSFWHRARIKYKLFILNQNTLEEMFSFRISWLSGCMTIFAFAVFFITLTSVVIINTPIRNYLPGYIDSEVRQEIIENAIKTDSLQQIIHVQSQYIENITGILNGTSPIAKITEIDSLDTPVTMDDLKNSDALKEFIQHYEEEHQITE
ncbi:MAG: hypothetical protein LBR66_06205 [Candidatus Symbiothrix sp.]|jgi:hypothetical protein|nr:hypothetical protein [Candidatus Symbiothrix sp.]